MHCQPSARAAVAIRIHWHHELQERTILAGSSETRLMAGLRAGR